MFETVYLTSAEKRGFLQEFTSMLVKALKLEKEKLARIEKIKTGEEKEVSERQREREEALERVKLIIRQFPDLAVRKPLAIEGMPVATEQLLTSNEKIDSLLQDPQVRMIECSEGIVKVKRDGAFEETGFILSEQEVNAVIKKFSEKTRIPFEAGIFKATLANLAVDAIISDIIGTRLFIIKS